MKIFALMFMKTPSSFLTLIVAIIRLSTLATSKELIRRNIVKYVWCVKAVVTD